MKPSTDKEAITLILRGLGEKGHKVTHVIDDTWNKDERTPVSSVEEAVDLITGVDEAFALFGVDDEGLVNAYIYFVLGNDPEEVAADYTTNLDPDLSNIVDPWWE